MAIGWTIATLATLVIYFSQNLVMVGLGLFLLGTGVDSTVNVVFSFFAEVVDDTTRQKYITYIQPFVVIGASLVTTLFLLLKEWRVVVLILMVIPTIVVLFAIILYI